jgi:hypothetical protein
MIGVQQGAQQHTNKGAQQNMRRLKMTHDAIMHSKTAVDTRLIRATVYGIPSKTRYFPLTASADMTNVDKNNPKGAQ